MIILDDLHWADQPSMLLLQHMARTLTDERLLLVANYRETESIHAAILANLLREPVTLKMHLAGLPASAVGRHLASVVGHEITDEQAEEIHALTRGNPFFVGEPSRPGCLPPSASASTAAPPRRSRRPTPAISSPICSTSPGTGPWLPCRAAPRGLHVASGAGAVAYLGPTELWLGVAAAFLGLLDDAVADLERAVRACAINGADGFHAEAQYELAAVLARRAGRGDLNRARSLSPTRPGRPPIWAWSRSPSRPPTSSDISASPNH